MALKRNEIVLREQITKSCQPDLSAVSRQGSSVASASSGRSLGRSARDLADDQEQIREEVEALKRKIAENKKLLSQVKAPPFQAKDIRDPAAEDEGPVPGETRQMGFGYYVYGVIGDDRGRSAGDLPQEGIDPAHPLYALPYQAIQAIVSKVRLQEFGQEALEANLNDGRWLEAKVRAHQGVLETVLANHTVIPMRLGTIYQAESGVQEMLAQHYDDFVEALERLQGKREWGVKVYCDHERLAEKVGEVSRKVRDLKREMAAKSEGAAYFLRKKLEQATAAEVERISDEFAQHTHDRLSSFAEEAALSALQAAQTTGRKETMVLNGAYLVAEERLASFRSELQSLVDKYLDLAFSYEMTGPWPAYNFVAISNEPSDGDE